MATLKDIADKADISLMAVSNILNGKNLEKWPGARLRAEKVRKIAAELGYRPDSAARAMRSKSFRHIGAVLLNTGDYKLHYMAAYEFVAGINERLNQDGYTLSVIRLSDLKDDPGRQRFFREKMLDGVICVGLHEDAGFVRALEDNTENCVWLDSNTWKEHGCIRRDEFHAAFAAAECLVAAGCREIAWKNWGNVHFSSAARDAGLRAALQAAKDVELVELGDGGYEELFSAAVRERKIGVLTLNSLAAQQTLVAGAKLGLCPGVDYALASCDEVSEDSFVWPELTRVSHWRFAHGEKAAAMMMDMLKGVKSPSCSIKGDLLKGETGCLNSKHGNEVVQ